jgi:deoxyribodipyrimidine photo-lyase
MIIYWHKRDYRLLDNQALTTGLKIARENNETFVPIMGLETDLINGSEGYEFGVYEQVGILNAILPLYNNYHYHGLKPYAYCDSIINVMTKFNQQETITCLISYQEHGTTYTYDRDKQVAQYCKENNIEWIELQPSSIVRNLKSRDGRDKYWKEYVNSPVLPIPNFKGIKTCYLEDDCKLLVELLENHSHNNYTFRPTSEKQGIKTLNDFVTDRARKYRGNISSPNTAIEYGSRLSQYIAYGSLSIRYIVQSFWAGINAAKANDDKKLISGILGALTRLHWREHFVQRLEDEPSMAWQAINIDYNNIEYASNPKCIEAFTTGHTGEPLIDACIRCLNQTGFINFRMRAMLVSYATFALDIDWRITGRILAAKFYDYEPGIHWSQVQMQSGITGINTIRVYSPSKQLTDQDPSAIFVKTWILELELVSIDDILNYNKVSLSKLSINSYPDPISDCSANIKINKAKLFNIKKANQGSAQAVFIKHGSRKSNSKPKSKPKKPKQPSNPTKKLF